MGSLVAVRGLRCSVACGILVPRLEVEPIYPALAGGFLTTRSPGKSKHLFSNSCYLVLGAGERGKWRGQGPALVSMSWGHSCPMEDSLPAHAFSPRWEGLPGAPPPPFSTIPVLASLAEKLDRLYVCGSIEDGKHSYPIFVKKVQLQLMVRKFFFPPAVVSAGVLESVSTGRGQTSRPFRVQSPYLHLPLRNRSYTASVCNTYICICARACQDQYLSLAIYSDILYSTQFY